ncbi:hypothetical protein BABINDRAFT_161116 [Babjeviella inositovora NRRL Y-12698]|uniref:RNase III domain-containing protein n=1 Tax=Babjeviella inositovora NRRL Y-12698 TaxID=984486 RepID=A0A1E3QSZ0_9ASCO|nr:uncharacterized protein BABINDRAFT_161116 [Babjeviella inositovora NRRL Y-12698]ODQ80132.1 hypothetical protein BABINDRAFT_161116 [Babjeviella inositovora NRRL Y-12698]
MNTRAMFALQNVRVAPTLTRTLVHLHSGKRVAGLKRNPSEYLKVGGYEYGVQAENLQFVKAFLAPYALPDEVVLQVLTHKSFAHGNKPYNDKLAYIGSRFLNNFLSIREASTSSTNAHAVNGLNFDVLGSPIDKSLASPATRYLFAKAHNLNKVLFWAARDATIDNPHRSGEVKITNDVVCALVGAVLLQKGEAVAQTFIQEKYLTGEHSLLAYGSKCVAALLKHQELQS